ncbi:hypothetical protein BS47DRAFT_1442286 [Hydnum rufescens UP504]|uniref:CxC2-like cysteine cluster KDZ transposase-associated domain-containing protein n=1 Tax=Hydnum rufescens UP504 TaxID=1448309 RepID=A0A9P6B1Z9_9AGAM|nr:hypothetical protein BS47DRAFT_1442286 [Hydnum rufescens UP504]
MFGTASSGIELLSQCSMSGTCQPAKKKAKLVFTRDFELQSQAVVQHIATTSSRPVLSSFNCIIVPATPDKPPRPNYSHVSPISGPDFGQDIPDDNEDLGTVHYLPGPAPCKHYANTDEPLKQWKPLRDKYLDALLFRDGRQGFSSGLLFISVDNASTEVYCVRIVVLIIIAASLCIELSCFEHTTLFELGLMVQLGHGNRPCPNPKKGPSSFNVIDTNGLHKVAVYFCDCSTAPHTHVQLLHSGWFLATVVSPQTCATFDVLHHFHLLSLQSKLSAHQFYCALKRETDNTGLSNLQCGGHVHDPSGTDGMKPGELTLTCPACPNPDINLPPNWEKFPRELHKVPRLRFSNMDYIIFSALQGYSPPSLMLSYDLICQYWTKIRQRMPHLPPELRRDLDPLSIKLFLPKLHVLAHKSKCSILYSLNFTPGVSCTDGEGIEQEWAEINITANSTKEMSEGSHHDTLDDLLGDKNFRKEIGLGGGKSLLTKLKTAQVESAKHVEQFESFTGGLDPAMVQEYKNMILAWEVDHSKLNPYSVMSSSKTQVDVRLELLESKQAHLSLTGGHAIHDTSATLFLRRLARDVAAVGSLPMSTQSANVYMPEMASLITVDIIMDTPLSLESSPLFLPHALKPKLWISPLAKSLTEMSAKLRFAQALDSLAEVWRSLYKADGKTKLAAQRYHCARQVYLQLVGSSEWENTLKNLEQGDVRVMMEDEGGGHNTQSRPREALWVEWSKSRARKERWLEEVLIIQEEMWQVLISLEHRAKVWDSCASMQSTHVAELAKGIRAYAIKQAQILQRRIDFFHGLWYTSATTSSDPPALSKTPQEISVNNPLWLELEDHDDSSDAKLFAPMAETLAKATIGQMAPMGTTFDIALDMDMLQDIVVDHHLPVQNMLATHTGDGVATPRTMMQYDSSSHMYDEASKGDAVAFSSLDQSDEDDPTGFASYLPGFGQSPFGAGSGSASPAPTSPFGTLPSGTSPFTTLPSFDRSRGAGILSSLLPHFSILLPNKPTVQPSVPSFSPTSA